jgi:hypothetical protein
MTTLPDNIEAALNAFMSDVDMDREEAVRRILSDWLSSQGYLKDTAHSIDEDTSETVQYPEFMEDASGGAGG